MIKENKWKVIITTFITLVPIIVGLILWKKLPGEIPTHWNAEGVIDGWSSKAFAVFFIPSFLTVMHLICILVSNADPKKKNYSRELLSIVFWICPVISVLIMMICYGTALGMELRIEKIMPVLVGIMFVVIGNYLPKCKQNYTMGIKIPWTLNDEENWNYTHRIAGRLWVATGFVVMICALLPTKFMAVAFIIIMTVSMIVPVLCSYSFYRKQTKKGE